MNITNEMVEIGAAAAVNLFYDWSLLDEKAKDMWRAQIGSAFLYSAPLIARAEAEEIADAMGALSLVPFRAEVIDLIRARHATPTPSTPQEEPSSSAASLQQGHKGD